MANRSDYVLTLVFPQAPDNIAAIRNIVLSENYTRLLASDGRALEFFFPKTDLSQAEAYRDSILSFLDKHNLTYDYALQREWDRRKKLLICDMDSTLIGQECIDELADFAGVKDRVSAITEKAMRGEIGFDGALRERVGLLKDLPLTALQACFDERIYLNVGAKTLAATMSHHGAATAIVSGGFTFFTSRIADKAGFDTHQANILLDDGERLLGTVADPILGREAKLSALQHLTTDLGGPENAVAIGDGANDLAMITAAGLGIAYYAKPAVAAAAHCAINHTDLTTALFFQGFHESEFIKR